MGLVRGGLLSLVQSVTSTIAQFVGQDVVAKSYTSSQASGSDAFAVQTNGARVHFGTGATDFASSDGTWVGFTNLKASQFSFAGVFANMYVTSGAATLRSLVADGANAVGVRITNYPALTASGTKICGFYPDSDTTLVASVTKAGCYNPQYTDDSANSGNRTVNTPAGANSIAIGSATCTITNSCVSATSIVYCVLQASDATATTILRVVPGSGSFTLTVNATATAATKFGWVVFNGT